MSGLLSSALSMGAGYMASKRNRAHYNKQQAMLDKYMKSMQKSPEEQRKLYKADADAGMEMTKGFIDEAGGKEHVFEEYMGTAEAKRSKQNLEKGITRSEGLYDQAQDLVSKSKEQLKGFNTQEMQGMRSTAAMQRQASEAEGARQAAGQMAASGMRGGRAAKAKAEAGLQARRDESQGERNLMMAQKQEQTRALGAYGQSLSAAGTAGDRATQSAQLLGAESRSQFDQAINQRQGYTGMLTSGATGMMSMGQTDRAQQDMLMSSAMQMKMAQGPEPAGGWETALGMGGAFLSPPV